MTARARYFHWRGFGLPARSALAYARAEERYAAILARFDSWAFDSGAYGTFAHADMSAGSHTIRALIGDDDMPYDWGDTEPTDKEREALSAFYVAVQVLDAAGEEVYHDGIGGVDAIDLPGYLQRDWEDAAAYALDEYLLPGAERFALNEDAERAHWAARDTITV